MKSINEQIEAAEDPRRRRIKAAAQLLVGVALFVLVLGWLAPDWGELLDRVELDLGWALVGLSGTTLASFVTAARWKLLAEVMGGTRLPFVTYFYGLVLTRFLGQFTSTAVMDLVGRGHVLRSAGSEGSYGHAAMQVVVERSLDAVLPLVLLGWAIAVQLELLPIHPLASLLLACVVFVVLAIPLLRPGVHISLRLYRWLQPRLDRLRRWFARLFRRAVQTRPRAEPELEPLSVELELSAKVAGLSLARFATVTLQFWGIARAVGIELSWQQITIATPVQQITSMIGLTPGGLGVAEAGWAAGLVWIGLDAVAISIFVLAQRVGVIVFFGLLSAISWPLAKRPKP
jgi:uncharacterized membrane protein YbhN (UPF0104 family)